MEKSNIVLDLVNTYSVRHELMNSIEDFLEKRTGSPFKNSDAVYLIVSVLANCDYEHYGPETILQDALKEYQKLLVVSE
jgi:glycerol-3-phosphate dehydrogenase